MRAAKKYGICLKKKILDRLYRDRHQQCPQDLYHTMAGKVKKLTKCTLALFNNEGNTTFIKIWKSIELPKFWSKLPNPITHQRSFMMSDLFHLAMLMPHILYRFLRIQHIKEGILTDLVNTIGYQHRDQVINIIIKCWVSLSYSVKQSFAIKYSDNHFETLSKALQKEHYYLTKVFPESFLNLPNLHINIHLIANANNYGNLVNTACGVKEAMHGLFKSFVPHTNKMNIDLDLLRYYNILQALRFWLDGRQDERVPNSRYNPNCSLLKQLLSKWYITKSPDLIDDSEFKNVEVN
ncbi:4833_t:CDS:2, partial [Racocetra persica]